MRTSPRTCSSASLTPSALHSHLGDSMTARNVQTAIVLQGGGALGAYEYGVLKALYESRPGFRPVAVAGISIGAITAAVLGGAAGDPIHALDTLWRRKLTGGALPRPPGAGDPSPAVLGNPRLYPLHARLFTAPPLLTRLHHTPPPPAAPA